MTVTTKPSLCCALGLPALPKALFEDFHEIDDFCRSASSGLGFHDVLIFGALLFDKFQHRLSVLVTHFLGVDRFLCRFLDRPLKLAYAGGTNLGLFREADVIRGSN